MHRSYIARFLGSQSMPEVCRKRLTKNKLSLMRVALQENSRLDGLSLSNSSLPTPKARNTKRQSWARDRALFNRSSRIRNIRTIIPEDALLCISIGVPGRITNKYIRCLHFEFRSPASFSLHSNVKKIYTFSCIIYIIFILFIYVSKCAISKLVWWIVLHHAFCKL